MVMYSSWTPPPGTAVTSGGTTRVSTPSGVISVPTSQYQPSTTTRPSQIIPIQTPSYQPKPTTLPAFTGLLAPVSKLGAQFAKKYPTLAQKIYTPFEAATVGLQAGYGREAEISKFVPTKEVKPFGEYITAGIYEVATKKAEDFRRWQQKQIGIVEMPIGIPGKIIEPLRKYGIGIISTPAIISETIGFGTLGAEYVAREPKQAIAGVPLGLGVMAGGIGLGFKERPFETAGELTGLFLTGKLGGKVPVSRLKPSLKPSLKPPIKPTLLPGKIIKLEAGTKLATAFGKVEPPIKQPLDFTQIKSLPGQSGIKVESWIKTHSEQNPVIGGSAAAKTQFRGARQPGDLDMFVKDPAKAGSEIHKLISSELGKENVRISHKPVMDSVLIEVKTEGRWHHAVDIHSSVPKGMQFDLGFTTKEPIRIGGIKYVQAGELIQRKAASILQPIPGGKLGPKPHRIKDISDFEKLTQDIISRRYEQLESAKLFKGLRERKIAGYEKALQEYQFYSSFGPDIYTTKAILRGYETLPTPIKAGISFAALGAQYPRIEGKKLEYPIYQPPYKVPGIKITKPILPSYYPTYKKIDKITHPGLLKPKDGVYYPPYKPDIKEVPYYPPYEPPTKEEPYYPPYHPPYEPPYVLPAAPTYKPPITPPTQKKPPFEKEEKKKEFKRKGKKPDLTGWLLENRIATVQQMIQAKSPLRLPKKVKR